MLADSPTLRSVAMLDPALPELPAPLAALRQHVLRTRYGGARSPKSGATPLWFLDTKQTACRPDGILLIADVLP